MMNVQQYFEALNTASDYFQIEKAEKNFIYQFVQPNNTVENAQMIAKIWKDFQKARVNRIRQTEN